ncbi:MAG: helix-turn-helix domain-containing protein [Bacteroidota bacterium]
MFFRAKLIPNSIININSLPYLSDILIASLTLLGFFILLVLYKKKKSFSDYTLISLNLICGLCLFVILRARPEMPTLYFFLHLVTPYLLFSVCMVYASQLITNKPWQKYYWLFFAFFIPMTLYLFYDIFLAHADFRPVQKIYYYDPPLLYHFFFKGNKIYSIVLCLFLLKQLNVYALNLRNHFSYLEKMRVSWLKHYVLGLILIYSFSLIAFLSYNLGLIEQIDSIYIAVNVLSISAFFYLSFHGIRYQSLETISQQVGISNPVLAFPKPKSATTLVTKSALKDDKSQQIYQQVQQIFEESQLFTKRQLKLSDLAQKINAPPYQLSQIINAYHGKPFYDFVASYRVNLLKKRLADPSYKQFTILSLGLDCGFNSKSSLNRVFKEHIGLTPAQYRKSHLPK